jgi:hypothetical protein
MFRDNSVECEGDWASTAGSADTTTSHQEIDRQLRRLAKQRAGLDAEEARWLRRADAQGSWRALGYVHALEYLEDVFGYAPRTAQEKLRVAKELGDLSALEAELEAGHLPYSIVRELTRIATARTEAAWIESARGRNYRQVEQMLAGRKKGDDPTDAPDPSLIEHNVTWKLDAARRALLRETRRQLENELGHAVDDATFVEMLCRRATEDVASHRVGEVPRPRVMNHITTCRSCKKVVQYGAGVPFELTGEQIDRAACDAIVVDDERGKRAASKIPAATRRRVFERDGYRCRFPGCRSTRNLDIHHLDHQAHGGDHRSGNLGTLCVGHHVLNHDGVITISGDADGELVFMRNGAVIRAEGDVAMPTADEVPAKTARAAGIAVIPRSRAETADEHRTSSRYREVERNTLAKAALQQSGFKAAVASRAVERALDVVPREASLEALLKEAFRHCSCCSCVRADAGPSHR